MHLKSKKTIFQLISLFLLFLSCSSCTDQTNQKGELKELKLELIAKENLLGQIETDLEKIVNFQKKFDNQETLILYELVLIK